VWRITPHPLLKPISSGDLPWLLARSQTYNKLHLPTSGDADMSLAWSLLLRFFAGLGFGCMQLATAATTQQIFLHLDTFGSNVRKFHWVSKS